MSLRTSERLDLSLVLVLDLDLNWSFLVAAGAKDQGAWSRTQPGPDRSSVQFWFAFAASHRAPSEAQEVFPFLF